jgi:hypothetical protein
MRITLILGYGKSRMSFRERMAGSDRCNLGLGCGEDQRERETERVVFLVIVEDEGVLDLCILKNMNAGSIAELKTTTRSRSLLISGTIGTDGVESSVREVACGIKDG